MRFWNVVKIAAGVLGMCAALVLGDRYRGTLTAWGRKAQPPAKTDPLGLGGEILNRRERLQINEVSQQYGRVKVLLDVARGKGEDVAKLDRLLVFSLALARQKKYEQALTLLNRISMDIPREKEKVVAARADDPLPEEPPIKTKALPKKEPPKAPERRRKR